MADLRRPAIAALAALFAACTAPAEQRVDDAELAALAPLKQKYSDLVGGLEIRPATTLIVSVDLQNYIEADDTRIAAMKREALARWRGAWTVQHAHEHALLRVRFIDFIGRKVGDESAKV